MFSKMMLCFYDVWYVHMVLIIRSYANTLFHTHGSWYVVKRQKSFHKKVVLAEHVPEIPRGTLFDMRSQEVTALSINQSRTSYEHSLKLFIFFVLSSTINKQTPRSLHNIKNLFKNHDESFYPPHLCFLSIDGSFCSRLHFRSSTHRSVRR